MKRDKNACKLEWIRTEKPENEGSTAGDMVWVLVVATIESGKFDCCLVLGETKLDQIAG